MTSPICVLSDMTIIWTSALHNDLNCIVKRYWRHPVNLHPVFTPVALRAPNPEDCQRIIDEWKSEINQAINENAREIDELLKKIDTQNKDITKLEAVEKRQEAKLEKLQTEDFQSQRPGTNQARLMAAFGLDELNDCLWY
ncbi:hypothetical protein TNCV_3266691 [Trichonephila clavipes]|nr:hypothetical protein TNCV_3266691 [Trichonephila clavipes]